MSSDRELKVGDMLRDNDPRMKHRLQLRIFEILPNGVRAEDATGRVFTYLRKRIHTDGKPRKNGLSLMPP